MNQVGGEFECPCGRGDTPCPGPDGIPLCATEALGDASTENRKTLDVLKSIAPTREADIIEHERQLKNATKLRALIDAIAATVKR